MEKPKNCCKMGSYDCQIPMPLHGRVQYVDFCIADIVAALNAGNIITEASCCGHGIIPGSILLADGRHLIVREKFNQKDIEILKGVKDGN